MQIYYDYPKLNNPTVLILGMFDGLHYGHSQIIKKAVSQAKIDGLSTVLCTFDKRPLSVVKNVAQELLSTSNQRIQQAKSLGVDAICIIPFNKNRSEQTAVDFLKEICFRFKPKHIFVGFNYSFGAKAKGNISLLEKFSSQFNFKLHAHSPISMDNQLVSSSIIRQLIKQSNIERANLFLDRYFCLEIFFKEKYNDTYIFKSNDQQVLPKSMMYICNLLDKNFNLIQKDLRVSISKNLISFTMEKDLENDIYNLEIKRIAN